MNLLKSYHTYRTDAVPHIEPNRGAVVRPDLVAHSISDSAGCILQWLYLPERMRFGGGLDVCVVLSFTDL